jgi:sugar phosphate isomerase/epimerase
MRSAITISLVPQTKGGPFVFSDGLADGCARAASFGFDAVEIFPRQADALDPSQLEKLLKTHRLQLAALGTGAGWVVDKLTLTSLAAHERREAREFVRSIIELGGRFGAPAIIGSMQGRWTPEMNRDETLGFLAEALEDLGEHAARNGTTLLYEPLNRYETNLFNRIGEAASWLRELKTRNVRILADLFHMNIEESDSAAALREAAGLVGHVHFADSNRRAMGFGQTDTAKIIDALREVNYAGFLSAEIFPLPDPNAAAQQTIAAFRKFVCNG